MHCMTRFELTHTDGDHIKTFETRVEALAYAGRVLFFGRVYEGATTQEREGKCTRIFGTRDQREAGNAGACLYEVEGE